MRHFMYYLKSPAPRRSIMAALFLAGLAAQAAAAEAKRPAFSADPLWDDGKAELSQYEGMTKRYGEPRPTRARIVVVKEDLLRDARVKSESGPVPGKTDEVLKLVFVAEFTTGSYFYRQAATTFLERGNLEVLKESMSHFDGCGITYVRVGPKQGRVVHEAHSYWEGEADREVPLVWPAGASPHVYWDALPLWLRGQIPSHLPVRPRGNTAGEHGSPIGAPPDYLRNVFLLPSQVGGRSPIEATKPVAATIYWSDAGTISVPAGRFPARLAEVCVTWGGIDRFWFDAAFPHVLLKMETVAGRSLELRKTQRLDYWKHHAVGEEKLVE